MAQGYTYKVLVNITRGIDKSVVESAKGMKVLMDERQIQTMLQKVGIGNGDDEQALEVNSKYLDEKERKNLKNDVNESYNEQAIYSGSEMMKYTEKRVKTLFVYYKTPLMDMDYKDFLAISRAPSSVLFTPINPFMWTNTHPSIPQL